MIWKKLDLEWKMIIVSAILLLSLSWPVHQAFVSRLDTTLKISLDDNLENILRSAINSNDPNLTKGIVKSLERNRQWKAMLPIIVKEQRQKIFFFTAILFLTLLILAYWTLKHLTKPIKDLSTAAKIIGKGELVDITKNSGGSLGYLEKAMDSMQLEIKNFREEAKVKGMEEAWRDIAKVMAHEIKNPLTPIRLTLERIMEKISDGNDISNKDLSTYMSRIETQTENLERLVNSFRSFAREPEVRIREVEIASLIKKNSEDMDLNIQTEISGTALILADPYLMNQIILNLWKNSIEANANRIVVNIIENKHSVNIIISDNGEGVETEILNKIWVPYVTTKPNGSGLGLPTVKRLLESMNASINADSINSSGFKMELIFKKNGVDK